MSFVADSAKPGPHACWVCGASAAVRWKERNLSRRLVPEDLQITDSRYGTTLSLWKCPRCSFLFADGDELSELTALYEQLADPEYENTQEPRALQMEWILRRTLELKAGARTALDVGAGAGLLVAACRRRGLDAVGVEPSRSLVEAAPRANGVELLHGVLPHPQLAQRQFDLVFLVDVLEHVADPLALLRHCAARLAPGGLFVVVTPDVGSVAAQALGRRWWHFRLAHVGYFNRRSLQKAAAAAGMLVRRFERPRWFFPVRYLTERLAVYFPLGWLNRLAPQVAPLSWLYRRVVPVNLHDSWLVFLARRSAHGRS